MSLTGRRLPRVVSAAAAVAVLYCASAVVPPRAWAHVHASADAAVRGAMATVTFQVPNESDSGAATTGFTVTLPDVGAARTETMPGWTAKLDRDAASGTVHSVAWTAAPNGGIGADQFALFRISIQLPDTATVSFPATQSYSDGSIVKWDQPPLPGGGEPERPAPTLKLTAGTATSGQPTDTHPQSKSPSNSTRLLVGAVPLVVVAALGVGLVLLRRRRS